MLMPPTTVVKVLRLLEMGEGYAHLNRHTSQAHLTPGRHPHPILTLKSTHLPGNSGSSCRHECSEPICLVSTPQALPEQRVVLAIDQGPKPRHGPRVTDIMTTSRKPPAKRPENVSESYSGFC